MTFYLIQQQKRVFAHTGRLLDHIVQFTVCTCLLTSIGAVVMVIVYYVLPDTLEWLALYTCLAKHMWLFSIP
ncbi:hypothetical protein BKA70DRAFT_1431997 [Coprinopsis sp. MPI-PUGE-AT-0042]|nr:hypothetical protein BKA70DRAFT_1431997 [Coprinopsis sp. MPI-PUGE-AT-0042]